MEIANIRERIFNRTKYEKNVARSSNPFATDSSNPFSKVSFKGNVLNADVFESSSAKTDANEVQNNKLTYSTLVGSLANLGSKIKERWNSVISFGSAMKDKITTGWDKLNNMTVSDLFNNMGNMVGNKYATMPINQIRQEFTDTVANLESGQF